MKERPILFSGAMVRAILDGRKTQTRRVMKLQPVAMSDSSVSDEREWRASLHCPYGAPGDRLWVRETWRPYEIQEGDDLFRARPDLAGLDGVVYAADNKFKPIENTVEASHAWIDVYDRARVKQFRPSIHMPRWASRITLEVVSVRVERLRDITEEDAIAEGVECFEPGDGELLDSALPFNSGSGYKHYEPQVDSSYNLNARDSFAELWRSINGADSWAANPWVWVVDFRRKP